MDSGSIIPADPVDGVKGQGIYDAVVKAAGCSGSSDTHKYLRSADYEIYLNATTSFQGIFDYSSWLSPTFPTPMASS
jgi:triacylglycerol lipase